MNIYLDIDGVLLANELYPAKTDAIDFIKPFLWFDNYLSRLDSVSGKLAWAAASRAIGTR